MDDIRDVAEGERPSASWSNEVKDAATRSHGSSGVSTGGGYVARPDVDSDFDIYELTGDPTLDSAWNEYIAAAKPVYVTITSATNKRYVRDDNAPTEYVGFVTQPRAEGEEPTAPLAISGDRVHTWLRGGNREVVGFRGKAVLIKGTCPATSASATYTLSSVVVLDNGSDPSTAGTLTGVQNYAQAIGAGTAICVADGAGGYRTLDAPCSA